MTTFDLPTELTARPQALIVLTGLDVVHNAIHKLIWDAFSNNRRPDRVPIHFKDLPGDHEYPKLKQKKAAYDWIIPRGILKSIWLRKHLYEIPAVVVVFFELDWDEHLWNEKRMECATLVEVIRTSLQGRPSKVAVVLIQKNTPLPPGEDVIAAERAAQLCTACSLSAKSLFVLPHTDHLLGYVIRLENAFYELAQGYYHTEARVVKLHRDHLNKTTHTLLFIRHQFKVAFYSELKQDSHTALKHYKQAYVHLQELRITDYNLLEIKTIAGFVNYKVCKLCFQHTTPLDAIAQFRRHVDIYKAKIGTAELSFEQSAWMSKQFAVFGDLFEEAITVGLTAIQTQHPGFYYQEAAGHAVARKKLCRGLCMGEHAYPSPDPLESVDQLEYYGQRPWRQGQQSLEPGNMQKEREAILALQHREAQVDHSWLVIPLLSSAVGQFKKYKSARMKRYLVVQMGEEYYHAKDYSKALTLLGRVMWDYRIERWWRLLTHILQIALRCAYLVRSIRDYVTISIELMGKYAQTAREEKTRIQVNLLKVLQGESPEAEYGCEHDSVEQSKGLWRATPGGEKCEFTIEMNNITSFVECKASFAAESFTGDSKVVLKVALINNAPLPIRFSRLAVMFSNTVYNQYCITSDDLPIADTKESSLYLHPGKTLVKVYSFTVDPSDVGSDLEVTGILLSLCTESSCCATLHWMGGGGDIVLQPPTILAPTKKVPPGADLSHVPWDKIAILSCASIIPREANLDVRVAHSTPALVNEFYRLTITVVNTELVEIIDITISVSLVAEVGGSTVQEMTILHEEPASQPVQSIPLLRLSSLKPQEKGSRVVYARCLKSGNREFSVKVTYKVSVDVDTRMLPCTCVKQVLASVEAIEPFEISQRLANMRFDPMNKVYVDEPFLLLTEVRSLSPWPLVINGSSLTLHKAMQPADEECPSQLSDVTLWTDDRASECRCLVASSNSPCDIDMGSFFFAIEWRLLAE
ncbi:PREDICTED: trafficking protein particle complex subunit 11-like [Priapulus caudatus]|uniref:Trafficking protein particle complex subunit 11-like n=1 Tax=Priapulus caudatus TaxID=37621 RepID=A0ABM1DQT8_PRICU|nr:PREDICTED: trafficking protein particle complex subunit 11-like [Priapulus caudatus]